MKTTGHSESELTHFLNLARTIWLKIRLEHETQMANTETRLRRQPHETKTLTIFVKRKPTRDTRTF